MKRLIVLNGPPGSGKDTVAKMISEIHPRYKIVSFKDFGFDNIHKYFNIDKELYKRLYDNRDTKETPCAELGGISPRDAIKKYFQDTKKIHGDTYFAKQLLSSLDKDGYYIISDLGFEEEYECLQDYEFILISIHRDGCDFSGDNRRYFKGDIEISNNTHDLSSLYDKVKKLNFENIKNVDSNKIGL